MVFPQHMRAAATHWSDSFPQTSCWDAVEPQELVSPAPHMQSRNGSINFQGVTFYK